MDAATQKGVQYLSQKKGRWALNNLPAIAVGYELAFGTRPMKPDLKRMRWDLRFLKLVTSQAYHKLSDLKHFSHTTRVCATRCHLGNWSRGPNHTNGITPHRLMEASTLSRACDAPITKKAIAYARKATRARWSEPDDHSLTEREVADFERFCCQFFGKPSGWNTKVAWEGRKDVSYYLHPSDKASLSHPQGKGGTAAELIQSYRTQAVREFEFEYDVPETNPNDPWDQEAERKAQIERVTRFLLDPEETFRVAALLKDKIRGPITPRDMYAHALKMAVRAPQPEIRTVPIKQVGKLRVASSHPGINSHVARTINQRLMQTLHRKGYTREALSDTTFELIGDPGAKLYSADLSAASDYIKHSLMAAFIRGAGKGQGWSETEIAVMLKIHGRQIMLEHCDRKETEQGAHMGLAGTWACLCALNAYCHTKACAYMSNNTGRNMKLCGDDLIALYTESQQECYDWWIKKVGLHLNKAKSFYGTNGVFCEDFVCITHEDDKDTRAQSYSTLKIAEVTGAKHIHGYTNSKVGIYTGILENRKRAKSQCMQRAALATLRRMSSVLNLSDNLPFHLGGSGLDGDTVSPSAISKLVYYLHNDLEKIRTEVPTDSQSRQMIANVLPPKYKRSRTDGVPVEDLITEVQKQINVRRKYESEFWGKPQKTTIDDVVYRRMSTHRGKWYERTTGFRCTKDRKLSKTSSFYSNAAHDISYYIMTDSDRNDLLKRNVSK